MRERGCEVCLDDFGSGFSSFLYLRHLPVGVLKIDGELIRTMTTDTRSRHLVKAIADLASGLGMMSVAEGIEDAETLEDVYEPFLLQLGLLMRTPKGRQATPRAYEHLGLPVPPQGQAPSQDGLF